MVIEVTQPKLAVIFDKLLSLNFSIAITKSLNLNLVFFVIILLAEA